MRFGVYENLTFAGKQDDGSVSPLVSCLQQYYQITNCDAQVKNTAAIIAGAIEGALCQTPNGDYPAISFLMNSLLFCLLISTH